MAKFFKSSSPSIIARTAALVLGGLLFLGLYIATKNLILSTLCSISMGLAIYFLFQYLLNVFIYEKIKILYSSINKIKTLGNSKNLKGIITENDPIESMEKQVQEWGIQHRIEQKQIGQKESFQKEFLGNVAHELKTPITNIQGYIHTLLDGALYDKSVNEKFLLKASKSADRMQYLVEELLSINRFEHGNLKLKEERFDIIELTKEVLDSLIDKANKHNTTISLNKEYSKPIYVLADKNLIHQVLTNLVVNGIKYNNKDGKISIGFELLANKVIIAIEDNGIGIAEEDIPRLFERFYRVDQSRARAHGGTGLGLAIVKHIILAHKQTISVNSVKGEGSTFSFSLETIK